MSKALPIQQHLPVQKNNPHSKNFKQLQEAKLRKASEMYEQKFLNTMMAQMRRTVSESKLMKKSFAEKIYQQKLDDKYVDTWTKKGGIGLADMIYNQLHEKIFPKNINRPQGPLPMDPSSKVHNLQPAGSSSEGQFKMIRPAEGLDAKKDEAQFYFKKNHQSTVGQQPAEQKPAPVQAPWDGTVTDVIPSGDQPGLLRIKHDNGLESTLAFHGAVEPRIQSGAPVSSGQRLGNLALASDGLFWRVRLKS